MDNNGYNLGSSEYDNLFNNISGLSWLPWVGTNYSNAKRKILFIAESHYTKGYEEDINIAKRNVQNDILLTREVIDECPINHEWANNMFDNLHRCLFQTTDFDSKKVWNEVAFYNFVQKPMDYNGIEWEKERPEWKDFFDGWRVFIEIIKILKPTDCIFVGVSASNSFNQYMDVAHIKYSPVEWMQGNGGAYGRKFSITIDDYFLECFGIRHTSKYFSWPFWNQFLNQNCHDAICYLANIAGINYQENEKNLYLPDLSWVGNVPTWLKHKPIIACDYSEVESDSDMRFLTIGRAQWNDTNDASIKTLRCNEDGHWSRMSEEVPIVRVPDMAIIFASTIKSLQSSPNTIDNSYLHEAFVNEEDKSFLKDIIDENKVRLKKSLSELKRLLNDIDLDNL